MTTDKIREYGYVIHAYRDLKPIAKSLHKLGEIDCNYGLTPRQEKRMENLLVKANNIAHGIGLKVYHKSDPRGASLYLVPDDNQTHNNDYTNGIVIY